MKSSRYMICRFAGWFVIVLNCALWADEPVMPPPAGFVDESAFREGLRQRGLTEWLDQYLTDTPPVDEVDKELRRREQLLDEALQTKLTADRRQELTLEASEILSKLITEHPEHPARLRWQLELARDTLEHRDPGAFDALLLYDLPGRDRETVCRLSSRAVEIIQSLRLQIAEIWKSLESLDESAVEEITASGSLGLLESLDARSANLLAWAQLYHTISADLNEPERREAFSNLLSEVTEHYGWTQPATENRQRCGALVIAAIAARRCGKFIEADQYARQIVATYKETNEPAARERLRMASILAVLEQIRAQRDAGKLKQSLEAIEQARQWANSAHPNDLQTTLAIALVERSVLICMSAEPTSLPAAERPSSLLHPAEALQSLMSLAAQPPTQRDALYTAIAGAVVDEPFTETLTPFQLQLLAGGAVADAIVRRSSPTPEINKRLAESIAAITHGIGSLPPETSTAQQGELLFLLAQANYLAEKPLEAVDRLTDLVERHPEHDRSDFATEQAVAIAQKLISETGKHDLPAIRAAFIRAGRLLVKKSPDSSTARRLRFFIALTLENDGQLAEAAREYAAVEPGDPQAPRAALGRVRCLRNLLDKAMTNSNSDESAARTLARNTLLAARDAVKLTESVSRTDDQGRDRRPAAGIVLSLADILNHPLINQPAETVEVLKDFEKRFADCPEAIGPALRERILALRQLKRLVEARQVVEKFLEADPRAAGPVMAKLLEAMRDEINAAADRGDDKTVKSISAEAVRLARALLDWSTDHSKQMTAADQLRIRIWLAWSLLNAGEPADASEVYQACSQAGKTILPANTALDLQIRLGQAECLLALERAGEALPIFTEVWARSPERSADWWRALVGSLESHTRLGSDPHQILQSIRQQRHLHPNLGGPRWQRELARIEQTNLAKTEKNHKD